MSNFTFTLEKYRGTNSRHTCPNCSARREFSRYLDGSGNYLADDVGKCNRESKCGHHKKPKEYFADNPAARNDTQKDKKGKNRNSYKTNGLEKSNEVQTQVDVTEKKDFIRKDYLSLTLTNYAQNSLVQFLSILFPDNLEAVQNSIQRYLIGTWKDGLTIFWQIDGRGTIRTGKLMRFDEQNGKRQAVKSWIENGEKRELKAFWMHKELIKQKLLLDDFNLKQCFFGEHLLRKEPNKIVAIVEAEKTAVICSICRPEFVWLAVGAKGYLTNAKLQIFAGRKVLLFPDADAYSLWQEKAVRAQRNGVDARISNLIETHGTDAEKENGFDLADYLIAEQKLKNLRKSAYTDLINSPFFRGWTNTSLF
jgi:hypothetical protein